MSSEYMRQILESIEMAQQIDEGYDERVQAVADNVLQAYPDGVPKAVFVSAVEKAAKDVGAIEMRKSAPGLGHKVGDSRKDFLKDVKAKIGRFKTDTSKASEKKARRDRALELLADYIQEGVGNAWPDGDPFDHIVPKARKLGIPMDDLLNWLDIAVKKHIGKPYKGYHDYVASTWDDFKDQTAGIQDLGNRRNPWR